MNAGIRVANLMSFSWICLRLDLYSFSSAVSCFFSAGVIASPFSFLVALTASDLLTTVSNTLAPSARKPSMFMTASIAFCEPMIFLRVRLSTLTSTADSHLRASRVAEVPDMAMSRMPAASTWVMCDPS